MWTCVQSDDRDYTFPALIPHSIIKRSQVPIKAAASNLTVAHITESCSGSPKTRVNCTEADEADQAIKEEHALIR